jgi:asparagine synthase (glutamine-hydrolysing)
MCGILGAFSRGGLMKEPALFLLTLDRLARRGPDDFGVWDDPYVQLGHRRLAVVDLSAAGHQPMLSSDGRYVITYNGEIYEHDALRRQLVPTNGWRGTSDTETLVEAYRHWGVDCLQYLKGKFAFAIWDRLERRLFLARDRMGLKPLYYHWDGTKFAFASRPGALVRLIGSAAPAIDAQALRFYLELGYIPAPLSFYESVRKLPPAHYMLVDDRGLRTTRYWDHRHIAPDEGLLARPEAGLADELEEQIQRAVKRRLTSDVPLGVFLSGGVDSAMIVAAMKAAGVARPQAFTIGFREANYDESAAAGAIAKHLGVEHHHELLDVDGLLQLLPDYIDTFDEPLADNSAFANMAVARLARRHVTAVLTGEGGDELFSGYHYYGLLARLSRYAAWPPALTRALSGALQVLPGHRTRLLAGALTRLEDPVTLFHYLRSVGKDFPSLLDAGALRDTVSSVSLFAQDAVSCATGLKREELGMRLDLGFMLPHCYLQKLDLATMAYSLEGRCPLLDHELVEWSLRLPLAFKQRGGVTKYLLKKALSRHLPPALVHRPKQGFVVPVSHWLRGPLKSWAEEMLYDDALLARLPLERSRVRGLFETHLRGGRDAYPLLWGVLMLLCFVAKHDRGFGLSGIVHKHAA